MISTTRLRGSSSPVFRNSQAPSPHTPPAPITPARKSARHRPSCSPPRACRPNIQLIATRAAVTVKIAASQPRVSWWEKYVQTPATSTSASTKFENNPNPAERYNSCVISASTRDSMSWREAPAGRLGAFREVMTRKEAIVPASPARGLTP